MSTPTRNLTDPDATQPKKITWGTAKLRVPAEIALHFPGAAEPLCIQLTQPIILGRAAKDNPSEMRVDLTAYGAMEYGVSRRHAQFEAVQETLRLTDLNSINGTYLNNHQLAPYQGRIVRNGDEIRLGELSFHIYF
jgi:hypothetical protein